MDQILPTYDEASIRAFNEGCQARIEGERLLANPYINMALLMEWQRGWEHVNRYWGVEARWPVLKLPEVYQ